MHRGTHERTPSRTDGNSRVMHGGKDDQRCEGAHSEGAVKVRREPIGNPMGVGEHLPA